MIINRAKPDLGADFLVGDIIEIDEETGEEVDVLEEEFLIAQAEERRMERMGAGAGQP